MRRKEPAGRLEPDATRATETVSSGQLSPTKSPRIGVSSEVANKQTTPPITNTRLRVVFIFKLLVFDNCIVAAGNHKKPFVYAAQRCTNVPNIRS
jgi:hypothetical protein